MSVHRHFCTYFDHRYLPAGLALHASLSRVCPAFTLWVLALDERAAAWLESNAPPTMRVVRLADLEAADRELAAVRSSRTMVEYYFTCSPCLPRYLIRAHHLDEITYLDADLWFFSSPEPLFDELGADAVAIVPHRFTAEAARTHLRYGRYNVGWLTFRATDEGMACLEWWRARCLEWCFDRVDGDRYADQKYLDRFQSLFAGVHAVPHPGANLAPWNVAGHEIRCENGAMQVDGRPLVFFHYQGLRPVSATHYDTNLAGYGARLTPALREGVFAPYIAELRTCESAASEARASDDSRSLRRADLSAWRRFASRNWRTLRSWWAGDLMRAGGP